MIGAGSVSVTIQAEGAKNYVRDVLGRFQSMDVSLKQHAPDLIRDFFRKQFETEGDYGGEKWQELTSRTLAIKASFGKENEPILVRFGDLRRTLTQPGQEGVIFLFGKNRLKMFITDHVARRHQTGDIRGGTPRVLLPDRLPEDFTSKLKTVIAGYLVQGKFYRPSGRDYR